MLTRLCNQTLHWLGLRVATPEEWQVVQHGLSPQRGQLVFVDRYRQRMQLAWRQCDHEPDLDRMLDDHRSRQIEQHPDARMTDLATQAGWAGSIRFFEDSGQAIAHAVRFDEPTGRLLEVTLATTSGAEDVADVEELLAGIVVESNAEAATRWRVFDLDLTTPSAAWKLVGAEVKPADVRMVFRHCPTGERHKPDEAEMVIRRMGMADVWWSSDLDAPERFLKRSAGRTNPQIVKTSYLGRIVTRAAGREPGPPLKRALGMLRPRNQSVWTCQRCNAVYHIDALGWRKQAMDLDAWIVRCGAAAGGCRD